MEGELYEYEIICDVYEGRIIADEITEANDMCIVLRFEGRVILMTNSPFSIRCIGKYNG